MALQLPQNLRFLGKIGLAAVVMSAALSGYARLFAAAFDVSAFLPQALLIGSGGVFGISLFFGLMLLLNVQEARQTAGAIAAFVARSGAHRP